MRNTILMFILAAFLLTPDTIAQERSFEPISKGGGIEVYLKMDFDHGENPFKAEGRGTATLASGPSDALRGHSLQMVRTGPGGYFGARTNALTVRGAKDLKIAFCLATEGMSEVTVNVHDAKSKDNTTPTAPARGVDGRWRSVVFAVEDFRYNGAPPQSHIKTDTEFGSLFFHGQDRPGDLGRFAIDKLIVYRGVDTQPPGPPQILKATTHDAGHVALGWKEPDDNAFAVTYGIYRKGPGGTWQKVGETLRPDWNSDIVPAPGKYAYRLTAADYDNNVSKPSEEATVEVASAGTPRQPTRQEKDRLLYAENVRRIHAAGQGKVRHDRFLAAGDSITAADVYIFTLGGWVGRGIWRREGVGGVQTDYGKNMIDKFLKDHRPEFAVIMFGTNNSKEPEAVRRAMTDLEAIIDACAAAGTVPVLATIPPRGYDKDKQEGQARYNQAVVELCHTKKVPVSYCFEEMMHHDLKKILSDGVHLVPVAGNDAAGEALAKTMEQVYFALRDTSGTW